MLFSSTSTDSTFIRNPFLPGRRIVVYYCYILTHSLSPLSALNLTSYIIFDNLSKFLFACPYIVSNSVNSFVTHILLISPWMVSARFIIVFFRSRSFLIPLFHVPIDLSGHKTHLTCLRPYYLIYLYLLTEIILSTYS